MKASTPALILYIISGLIFFLSSIMGYEYLVLIAKPIIVPSIFFYYWQESQGKINFWFSLILFCLFASEIFNLFDGSQIFVFVVLFNLSAYCILLSFIIKKLLKLKIRVLDKINLSYIILMFLFLCCLLYVSLFLVFDTSFKLYGFIAIYDFVLVTIGFLNALLYVFDHNKANTYLMMTVFSFIICDLFFAIYYYYYDFIFFRYISIVCNIISLYFLVRYFLLGKEKRIENKEVDSKLNR